VFTIDSVVLNLENKKKKAFTSIRVDPELWKEVKIEAIRRDMEVSEFVGLALRKELQREPRGK
jgi:hypothetical protein